MHLWLHAHWKALLAGKQHSGISDVTYAMQCLCKLLRQAASCSTHSLCTASGFAYLLETKDHAALSALT